MGEPSWSGKQVVGLEEETGEKSSKVLRAETNWESAGGCLKINFHLKPEMKS